MLGFGEERGNTVVRFGGVTPKGNIDVAHGEMVSLQSKIDELTAQTSEHLIMEDCSKGGGNSGHLMLVHVMHVIVPLIVAPCLV
jgi:hypothetical protein